MRPDESDESLPGAGGIQGRGRVRRGQKTQCDLVLEGADMDTKLSGKICCPDKVSLSVLQQVVTTVHKFHTKHVDSLIMCCACAGRSPAWLPCACTVSIIV